MEVPKQITALLLGGMGMLWLATARPLVAQEGGPPRPLSLQECLTIAQANQTDILVAEQSVAGAKARYTQSKSGYFPQVSVQSTPLFASGKTDSPGTDNIASGQGTYVNITQSFYDGGARAIQVKQSKYSQTQNEASLVRVKQTVDFNVTKAYFDVLRARHLADVSDARVKYLQQQLVLVRTRIELGDAAAVDSLPIEAQLANAQVDLLAAKNNIRTATIQLQNTMGLSSQPEFAIEDITEVPQVDIQPIDSYQTLALASRPDVQQSAATVGVAESGVKSAKIALQPQFIAGGQYGLKLDSGLPLDWKMSAGITYDIFNGKRNRAAYDEAKTNLTSAQQRAQQVAKDITAQVQEGYLNLTNARERMAAATVSVQAAQANFDAQNARYQEGLGITLDLLNAQVDVTTAQSNDIQARYDYYTALAQLTYATGQQGGLNGN